jgi:CheY-like chemotaxis protein
MVNNGITVLVVEDEMLIRMDIVEFLQDEGFTVHEASNADDAIAILIANPDIRVLFTDIDDDRGSTDMPFVSSR